MNCGPTISLEQAAQLLGVKPASLRQRLWRNRNNFGAVQPLGKHSHWRVRRDVIEKLLA